MNDDFLIEPRSVSDYDIFFALIGSMGFSNSRYIIEMPRSWRREVHEILEKWPDGPRQLAARKLLENAANAGVFVRSGLPFSRELSWRENARPLYERSQGIFVSAKDECTGLPNCVTPEEFFGEKRAKFLKARRSVEFLPTAEAIGELCRRLIECSKEIIVVDPFFKLQRQSNLRPLRELIAIASKTACKKIILFSRENDELETLDSFVEEVLRRSGLNLEVVQVSGEPGGNHVDFHARFVFSRKGGIQFDYGIREDWVKRLASCIDEEILEILWDRFVFNRDELAISQTRIFR
jgi:hypothetical protein